MTELFLIATNIFIEVGGIEFHDGRVCASAHCRSDSNCPRDEVRQQEDSRGWHEMICHARKKNTFPLLIHEFPVCLANEGIASLVETSHMIGSDQEQNQWQNMTHKN